MPGTPPGLRGAPRKPFRQEEELALASGPGSGAWSRRGRGRRPRSRGPGAEREESRPERGTCPSSARAPTMHARGAGCVPRSAFTSRSAPGRTHTEPSAGGSRDTGCGKRRQSGVQSPALRPLVRGWGSRYHGLFLQVCSGAGAEGRQSSTPESAGFLLRRRDLWGGRGGRGGEQAGPRPPRIRVRQELKHRPPRRDFPPHPTDAPGSPEGMCPCARGGVGGMREPGDSGTVWLRLDGGHPETGPAHLEALPLRSPQPLHPRWFHGVSHGGHKSLNSYFASSAQKEAVFANLLHKHVLQSWGFIKPCTQSNYRKNSALFAYLVFKGLLM